MIVARKKRERTQKEIEARSERIGESKWTEWANIRKDAYNKTDFLLTAWDVIIYYCWCYYRRC